MHTIGAKVPRNFHSRERRFLRTCIPGNESSIPRTLVSGNENCCYLNWWQFVGPTCWFHWSASISISMNRLIEKVQQLMPICQSNMLDKILSQLTIFCWPNMNTDIAQCLSDVSLMHDNYVAFALYISVCLSVCHIVFVVSCKRMHMSSNFFSIW